MPRKKNPNNNYFNQGVEDAIHLYNQCTDDSERNKLFSIIYPALAKICQVWRNKIKPTYVGLPDDEMEADCMTYLLERLGMIKADKGKAFSYLTVSARNYYIQLNQIAYRKRLNFYSIDRMPEHWDVEDIKTDRVVKMEYNAELFYTFVNYLGTNFNEIFTTDSQKKFGIVLLDKLKTDALSENFNKRKLLNDIAKESGMERGRVTKQINRISSFYSNYKEYYKLYRTPPEFDEKITLNDEDKEYINRYYIRSSKKYGVNAMSRKLGIRLDILKNYVKSL